MIRVTVECGDDTRGISEDLKGINLENVLECCEQAIYACGYRFKGHLDFVEEE